MSAIIPLIELLTVIITIGFPGSGKSSLSIALKKATEGSVYLDQDYFKLSGSENPKEAYLREFETELLNPDNKHIILGTCNLWEGYRNDLLQVIIETGINVNIVYVEFGDKDGNSVLGKANLDPSYRDHLVSRIKNRVNNSRFKPYKSV